MISQGYLTLKRPSLRVFLASMNILPNRFLSKCLTGPPELQHILPKYESLAGFHSVFLFSSQLLWRFPSPSVALLILVD